MELSVRQLHALFAGEVTGVDVGRPLDSGTVHAITEAIDRYAVLVFRGQRLDDERQMEFARNFGELEIPRSGRANVKRRLRPEMADISNLDEQHRLRGRDDPRRFDQLGNRLWHTDGSFRRVPAMLAMPGIAWSRAQLGFTDLLFGEKSVLPPVPQRLVRTHPGSGRKTLYIAAHASEIVGWPLPDGRLLLRELIEHATSREFVYRHQWREGDLGIWDNRCTMHRGRHFDECEVRGLRWVTTRDTASTLDQVA